MWPIYHSSYSSIVHNRVIDQLKSRSALYDRAELPVKKMIASAIIERVTVYKDYRLEIKFNITYEQFIGKEGNEPISVTLTGLENG